MCIYEVGVCVRDIQLPTIMYVCVNLECDFTFVPLLCVCFLDNLGSVELLYSLSCMFVINSMQVGQWIML